VCFSATASFTLSGILTAVGVASVARAPSRAYAPFAAIPLVFAAQQAAEGVVWSTMANSDHAMLHQLAVIAFLGVALVVWPIWLPLSLRLIEQRPARRRALAMLTGAGIAAAASAVILLMRAPPVAVVAGHSIRYDRAGDVKGLLEILVLAAYALPTIVPLFVSTVRLTRTLGILLVISLAATALIEQHVVTSVWCFFAAVLSVVVLLAVRPRPSYRADASTRSKAA
jgi:hypothetical protein